MVSGRLPADAAALKRDGAALKRSTVTGPAIWYDTRGTDSGRSETLIQNRAQNRAVYCHLIGPRANRT